LKPAAARSPHAADFAADTTPEALVVFYELQRQRTPSQKLNDVFELTAWMFANAEAGVRLRYPGISDREVFLRAASLRIPRDLMIAAYGWDPDAHG
jgi:hypothetical protein